MKVISVLALCLLVSTALAISCGQDGFVCEGPFVVNDVSMPYDSVLDTLPVFAEPMVEITNATLAEYALRSEEAFTEIAVAREAITRDHKADGGVARIIDGKIEQAIATDTSVSSGIQISISVGEITSWINAGGNNPLEAGLIRKILTYINSAGISIQAGSLVYQFNNGPEMELQGGCTPVHLQGGWNARATLKPGFRVTLNLAVNDWTLVVSSQVVSDCDFAMGGRIRAKFGKKVLGKCIHLVTKTESVNIGAYMVMNVISRLELKPTLNFDAQLNAVIGLQPYFQIRGDLLRFEPNGKVSITIFGIHIGFIEKAISNGIRNGIKAAFNQRTVNEQFAAATNAVQNSLNNLLRDATFKIPLLPPALKPSLTNAVNNIRSKQAANM